ncbi:Uncharacterised protein [Catenibacterium mitsuokai]|nr:Uncharacterised protein [Catenibacterium mitsuokai]
MNKCYKSIDEQIKYLETNKKSFEYPQSTGNDLREV